VQVEEGDGGSGSFGNEGDGDGEGDGGAKGSGKGKGKGRTAKKVKTAEVAVKIHPPAHWEEIYDAVREMRKHGGAPVDTMGCERLADPSMSEKVCPSPPPANIPPIPILPPLPLTPPQDQRFQTLLALMLSSQTRDPVTATAIHTLHRALPGGLTLASILATPAETLNALIRPVGFHNAKTAHILATAALLARDHAADIPDTAAGLMALPGVGPKMAFLCLSAAWGRTEGIGVDVHVHRITNRWGWHRTRGPEETRRVLEAWLPRERWREVNALLVGFGQTVCLPVGRRCGECAVGRRGLCPSAVVGTTKEVVGGRGKRGGGDVKGKRTEEDVVVKEEEGMAGGGRVVREGVVGLEGVGEDWGVVKEGVLEGGKYVLDEGEERVKVEDEEGR